MSLIDSYRLTYADLEEKIRTVSAFLKDDGIGKEDRVAIIGENHPNWAVAFFSIASLGAIAVPIMHEFNPAEIHHIIRHAEAKAIFISSRFLNKIEDGSFSDLKTTILLDDFSVIPHAADPHFLRKAIAGGIKGFQKIKSFQKIKTSAMEFAGRLPQMEVSEDDIASIVYTSGTTGHSKGVMLTHKNLVSNAMSVLGITNVTKDDVLLSILPLSHTMECTLGLLTPIMLGASVYYLDKPPTAASLLPALKKIRPTVMLSVPLIIEKIYKNKILPEFQKKVLLRTLYKYAPSRKWLNKLAGKKLIDTFGGSLKIFAIGGAPLSEDVEEFLVEAEFPYTVGYGMTEASPLITGTEPKYRRPHSAGKVLKGVEVKIEAQDPLTGIGEIVVRGPNVMKGYYKSPEKTKEVLGQDGWLKTGDLGVLDKDGYLFIKGRSKNLILGSNGKNIYPEELESLINENKYVVESLVHEKDKRLVARVHLDYKELDQELSSKHLSEGEIRAEVNRILESILRSVNNRVASFSKIWKVIEQTYPFEKTPTQKIKRHLYKE